MEQKQTLEDWVQFLSKEQMPALAETVQKLNRLATDDDSRVSQLTEQILKDPSLTSRVLQVSNCVMYKGVGGSIKTITRAIVMLGFTAVRDISLSMQILDNILKHNPSQHLMMQIANSFHAAMQARGLIRNARTNEQEEIFISTLLLHFSELSMLSRDDEVSRRLNYMISQSQNSPENAAKEVIGCTFRELSLALAKHWELGDVLQQALSNPGAPSKPVQAVLLGEELSQVAPMGWNADPVVNVIKKIAKYRNIPYKEAHQDVIETASLAHDMAVHYGAARVRHLIPHPDKKQDAETTGVSFGSEEDTGIAVAEKPLVRSTEKTQGFGTSSPTEITLPAVADEGIEDLIEMALGGGKSDYPESVTEIALREGRSKESVSNSVGDIELQMNIMQELSRLIAEKRMDVNKMLELVLQGMNDAIGLDRVVMALVSRDRKTLVPKFFRGEVDEPFRTGFRISLNEENAFSICVLQSQQLWMGSKMMAGRAYLHTAQLQKALNYKEYLVAPIIVARKPIGLFYGDSAASRRPLNDQQYAGFNMLAQQAGMALTASKS